MQIYQEFVNSNLLSTFPSQQVPAPSPHVSDGEARNMKPPRSNESRGFSWSNVQRSPSDPIAAQRIGGAGSYARRGLACDVGDGAVDLLSPIDDPHRDLIPELIGEPRPVRGHNVVGGGGPEGQSVVASRGRPP